MTILETLLQYAIIGFGLSVGGYLGFALMAIVFYMWDELSTTLKIRGFLNNDSGDKFKSN